MNKLSSATVSLVLVAMIFLAVNYCKAELCPDQKISCRRGQTCCDNKQGGYGCCPYENATCCSDGLSCCPEDTQCDLHAGRCRRSSRGIKLVSLIPGSPFDIGDSGSEAENELDSTFAGANTTAVNDKKQCPDLKSSCPSTYTCCADPEGSYACCPFPDGTCCPDKIHCCPHGRQCKNYRCV